MKLAFPADVQLFPSPSARRKTRVIFRQVSRYHCHNRLTLHAPTTRCRSSEISDGLISGVA